MHFLPYNLSSVSPLASTTAALRLLPVLQPQRPSARSGTVPLESTLLASDAPPSTDVAAIASLLLAAQNETYVLCSGSPCFSCWLPGLLLCFGRGAGLSFLSCRLCSMHWLMRCCLFCSLLVGPLDHAFVVLFKLFAPADPPVSLSYRTAHRFWCYIPHGRLSSFAAVALLTTTTERQSGSWMQTPAGYWYNSGWSARLCSRHALCRCQLACLALVTRRWTTSGVQHQIHLLRRLPAWHGLLVSPALPPRHRPWWPPHPATSRRLPRLGPLPPRLCGGVAARVALRTRL